MHIQVKPVYVRIPREQYKFPFDRGRAYVNLNKNPLYNRFTWDHESCYIFSFVIYGEPSYRCLINVLNVT